MKVEAYIVDCCGALVPEDETMGIIPTEDIFDKIMSYPTTPNPAKAPCHHCMDCYRKKVIVLADATVDRKKDEKAYSLKLRELHYSLRSTAVSNYRARLQRESMRKK